MWALRLASTTYRRQAVIRRQLKAGTITLTAAMLHPWAQSDRVDRLVMAQNRWGPIRTGRALTAAGLWGTTQRRRVRELTARQRLAVVTTVEASTCRPRR